MKQTFSVDYIENKWTARMFDEGITFLLGHFNTKAEAEASVVEAKVEIILFNR